jgi:hypothetical protein
MRITLVAAIVLACSSVASYSSAPYNDAIEPSDLHPAIQAGGVPGEPTQYSNRCYTPNFWCYLSGNAPVGARCWCATPYGPVAGVVR